MKISSRLYTTRAVLTCYDRSERLQSFLSLKKDLTK
jgi:hypothetical protein